MDLMKADRREEVRIFYAAATGLDSRSWEQPFGSPPEYHGVFSHALMEALESESLADTEGRLTGRLLSRYLHDQVPKLRQDQKPKIQSDELKDLTLVHRSQGLKENLRIVFSPSCAGEQVNLFSGGNPPELVATHVASADPWTRRADYSYYKLATASGQSKLFEVAVGQEVTVVQFP